MLVEQVDAIGREAAERALDDLADVLRPAVDADVRAVRIELEAELRGDDDAVTRTAPERVQSALASSSSFLYGPYASAVSRNVHAELDGAVDGGDGLALVALLGGAVGLASFP